MRPPPPINPLSKTQDTERGERSEGRVGSGGYGERSNDVVEEISGGSVCQKSAVHIPAFRRSHRVTSSALAVRGHPCSLSPRPVSVLARRRSVVLSFAAEAAGGVDRLS